MERIARHKLVAEFTLANLNQGWEMQNLNLGASVNGKPTVSKTVTAGSSPAAPVVLEKMSVVSGFG